LKYRLVGSACGKPCTGFGVLGRWREAEACIFSRQRSTFFSKSILARIIIGIPAWPCCTGCLHFGVQGCDFLSSPPPCQGQAVSVVLRSHAREVIPKPSRPTVQREQSEALAVTTDWKDQPTTASTLRQPDFLPPSVCCYCFERHRAASNSSKTSGAPCHDISYARRDKSLLPKPHRQRIPPHRERVLLHR
jgi:hypothetical protein